MKIKSFFTKLIIVLLFLTFFNQPLAALAKNNDVLTEEMKTELMNEINAYRAEHGIPPVKYNSDLQKGVNIRADEIIKRSSHERPDGSAWFTAFNYTNEFMKMENLAFGHSKLSDVLNDWKNSPDHKINLLHKNMESVALGVYQTPQNKVQSYWALVGAGHINYLEKEITETEKLDFKTVKEEDPTLDRGIEKVKQEGKNGTVEKLYNTFTHPKTNELVFKHLLNETITQEAIDEIILIGTKKEVKVVTEEEVDSIPYETKYVNDPELEKGKKVVKQAGKDGQIITSYQVTYEDDIEVKREQIDQKKTEAIDEIIHLGTKEEMTFTNEVEEKVIPFETITQYDPELEIGKVKTVKPGVQGKLTITYKVTYLGDVLVSKEEINREQIEAVTRLIVKGTKVPETDYQADIESVKPQTNNDLPKENKEEKEQDKLSNKTHDELKNKDKQTSNKEDNKASSQEKLKKKLPSTATKLWDNLFTGSLFIVTGLFGLYFVRRF